MSLITPVADRPGHDRRYCVDTSKLRGLGWAPQVPFEQGLHDTVEWYRRNEWWWRPIKEQDPAFRSYYQAQYERRT
jgi:dTDP-glucose 4,6-dehydratase